MERDRERDLQHSRLTDGPADGRTDSQPGMKDTRTGGQMDRQTNGQTDKQPDIQMTRAHGLGIALVIKIRRRGQT